jgi:hypothetical protein
MVLLPCWIVQRPTRVPASFAACFQERVIGAQIHRRYLYVGRLPQRGGFPQQRAHGLLAQRPTLVEQLAQGLFDTAFAFLISKI